MTSECIREHTDDRPGLTDEQDIACSLDHLHTPATALAGIASEVADRRSATQAIPRRTRPAFRSLRAGRALGALPLLLLPLSLALTGVPPFGAAPAASAAPATANGVTGLGGAPDLGPAPGLRLAQPLVGVAPTPSGGGYWLAAADGGVFGFGDAAFHGSAGALPLEAPVVGIAATPSGGGYWLVAADGGVFTYGDAAFLGSAGALALRSPIVGLAATPSGGGYWLVAADGGVFTYGDAAFFGSTGALALRSPIVGLAATPSGGGYRLVAADGGVFTFGDAAFLGSAFGRGGALASGIAADPGGDGYWIVALDGSVHAFGSEHHGAVAAADPAAAGAAGVPSIGIAARPGRGYWVVQGEVRMPAAPRTDPNHPFLVCTRARESRGNYQAVSASGTYRGAYQFSRSTWDATARHAGRPDLVGVDPAAASPADQDFLALHLYGWQGAAPWLGRCAGL